MKSLWRVVGVAAGIAAVLWGAWFLLPPPQATRAEEEPSGRTTAARRIEPTSPSRTIWRQVPAEPSPHTAAPTNLGPARAAAASPAIGPRASSRLVVSAGSNRRATEIVSLDWGNADQLVRDVARVWPKLRANRLQLRNSTLDLQQTPGSGPRDAPVLVATRPNRIYIVSDDPEAVATLKAILGAFRPTPGMQGLPLSTRRLEHVDAGEVASEIEKVKGTGIAPNARTREASAEAEQDAGPLGPLRRVMPQSIRIYADATTNTLIYQARHRELALLEGVLNRLERTGDPDDHREPHPNSLLPGGGGLGLRDSGDDLPSSRVDHNTPTEIPVDAETEGDSLLPLDSPQLSPQQRALILRRFREAGLRRRHSKAGRDGARTLSGEQHQARAQRQGSTIRDGDPFDDTRPGVRVTTVPRRRAEATQETALIEPTEQHLPDPHAALRDRRASPAAHARAQGPRLPTASVAVAANPGLSQQPGTPRAQQSRQTPAQPGQAPEAIQMRGLRGEVQIEVIPELGIFLIQATSDEDAEEVERIIRQIELISAGRAPVVEIVPLQHVQATALAAVINSIYSQLLGSRGLVTAGQEVPVATSLVRPNALLLIAPGDDMEYLRGQIQRLDQPAEAETQFKTFRLQHAPAQILKDALDEFYADPTGLAPVVRVTAEPRSNALVVQAAPNDMAEITEWIRQIDVAGSATVNDLRIFRLRNASAADLAEILQEAILGVLSPASRAGGLGATTGAGALAGGAPGIGGQQGAARLLQEATSSVLRFSVGPEAQQRQLVSGILSEVRITAEPASNALIVSAPEKSMQLLAAVITELDALPETVASIQIFPLLYGDATNVATMLQTLFQPQAGADAGPQAILQAAGPGAEGSTLVPLRFSVDRRTNTIIAVGNQSDLITVHGIIEKLDTSEVIIRETKVFRLKHSPAVDIATAVNDLITAERTQLQQIDPEYVSAFEQLEREVIVVAEPVNNFLLISATQRYFEKINLLVEELDKRPPMVAIQVLIAEIEIGDHDEFGIELGIQDSLLFDRSFVTDVFTLESTVTGTSGVTQTAQTVLAALLDPGFNFNNQPLGNAGSDLALRRSDRIGPQGLTNFAMGRVNGELGYGGLVLSAGSENVSLLLRALRQYRRVDVLSRPQIVTLDNQPGYIQVGARVPFITAADITEVGQQNTIDFQDVGLIVQVTPRISPDGIVTMVVDATRSEVGPESEGIPVSISASGEVVRSPQIPITRAQTTISARGGQTVIIGGLLTKENTTVDRRVPFLSDIPILGHAFRYDLDIERRSELLIILTPRIIREDEDAELLKQMEARRMSWVLSDVVELQGDIGVYEEHAEADGAHEHEHVAPEMELSEPAEAPAPELGLEDDEMDRSPVPPPPVIEPQASVTKRKGPLARFFSKWRWKPDYNGKTADDWKERDRRTKSREKVQTPLAGDAPQSRPSHAGASRDSWDSTNDQTILPAARWQELEEIKNGARTKSTSE